MVFLAICSIGLRPFYIIGSRQLQFVILCRFYTSYQWCTTGLCTWANFVSFVYNDVTDIFDGLSVTCKLYADDIKLYTSYCFNQLHSNLVDATERLIAWADNWQLKLAADKCIVCRLKQSQWPISWDASNTEYKINDSTLQYKDNVRDLGVIIDCNLNLSNIYLMLCIKHIIVPILF